MVVSSEFLRFGSINFWIEYRRIAQPLKDALALPARRQQAGPAHDPQVLRGVGNRQPNTLGQRFDAALALGEQLQDLQPMAVAERLGDLGETGKLCALGIFVRYASVFKQTLNELIE